MDISCKNSIQIACISWSMFIASFKCYMLKPGIYRQHNSLELSWCQAEYGMLMHVTDLHAMAFIHLILGKWIQKDTERDVLLKSGYEVLYYYVVYANQCHWENRVRNMYSLVYRLSKDSKGSHAALCLATVGVEAYNLLYTWMQNQSRRLPNLFNGFQLEHHEKSSSLYYLHLVTFPYFLWRQSVLVSLD